MPDADIKKLISKFSHDVRNPLTSSKLFLDMLENGLAGELTDKQKDMVAEIAKAQDDMLAILDSFRAEFNKLL